MTRIDGDIVPLTSGTSHLGVNSNAAGAFDITSITPFGNIHQLSGVFHNINGSSGVIRFGINSFELSTDGGKTFSSPVIVGGNNGDVFFNDAGTLGTDTLGITYNKTIDALGVSGELQMGRHSLDATALGPRAGSGVAQFVAINLAERPMFGASNSGMNLPYIFQPALFNRFIFMANPSLTTIIGTYGNTVTSVGTVSHVTNVQSGVMINQVTGAGAGSTAGTGASSLMFYRGAASGLNTGYFFSCRITLPDANLDAGRVFAGVINASLASSVTNDDPGADHCGFSFSTVNSRVKNWHFSTGDGSAQTVQDTGISCSGNRVWDMYIYSPPYPNINVTYWTLHDVSWNRISSGYAINTLPRVNTNMRPGIQLNNITASARNIRFQHIYCESLQ